MTCFIKNKWRQICLYLLWCVAFAVMVCCGNADAMLKSELIGSVSSSGITEAGTYVTSTAWYLGDFQGTFYYEAEVTNCVIDVDLQAGESGAIGDHHPTGVDADDNDLLDSFAADHGPEGDGSQYWYPDIWIPNAPYISLVVTPEIVTNTGSFSIKLFGKKEVHK